MDDTAARLECLRLALQHHTGAARDMVATARTYADFVTGKNEATPPQPALPSPTD